MAARKRGAVGMQDHQHPAAPTPATIGAMGGSEYADLYRADWDAPRHRRARDRGRTYLNRERAVFRAVFDSGARSVLDVGCSDGYLARLFAEAGLYVYVTDVDQGIVDHATFFAGLPSTSGVVGLAEEITGENIRDAVTCCEVVEHVRDPQAVVRALHRAARKVVVMTTPVGHCYDDPLHIHHWEDEESLREGLGLGIFGDVSIDRIPSKEGDAGRVFLIVGTV